MWLIQIEYKIYIISVFICLMILGVVWWLVYYKLTSHYWPDKLTPYECGFEHRLKYRRRKDLSFYLVGLGFLILDVEFCFIIPLISARGLYDISGFVIFSYFMAMFAPLICYEFAHGLFAPIKWTNKN